jgi:fructose-1,6-bisphosphatase/sedoheptulose 1,7-bisphosphatase-like protein
MVSVDHYRHIDFLRVTEEAALSASKWVGKNKKDEADDAACQAMRNALNSMEIQATVVLMAWLGHGRRNRVTGAKNRTDLAIGCISP